MRNRSRAGRGRCPSRGVVGEPFAEFVRGFALQAGDFAGGVGRIRDFVVDPFAEFVGEFAEAEEAVQRLSRFGDGAGDDGGGVF